jgi:hypothetical protein
MKTTNIHRLVRIISGAWKNEIGIVIGERSDYLQVRLKSGIQLSWHISELEFLVTGLP